MFSLRTHYALKLLVFLAVQESDELFTVDVLAEKTGVPRSFLGKIVQSLGKKGYLTTKKGPSGGVTLRQNPSDVSITDVLEDLGELQPQLSTDKACCKIEAFDNCIMEQFISDFITKVIEEKSLSDIAEDLVATSS